MFQFTRFVMEDFIDSSNAVMYVVSLSNRYMVYNTSRRRLTISDSITADFKSPFDLITNENLALWTRVSRYRVRGEGAHAPRAITYKEASEESRDRYDMHQIMRRLLTPSNMSDIPRLARNMLSVRIDLVVEAYAKKHDREAYGNHTLNPHAVFKGGHHYSDDGFKLIRSSFQAFGHLVARAKAGDESISNDAIRTAFFDLSNRYGDFTSHLDSAFTAIDDMDMGITHCDCGHYEDENNTHSVRNDTWCDSCFDDDAVYVEDQDEHWPRDDAYFSERDDCYYSYDRDNDDDDDEDDPDTTPIMSYSTNVLHVLDSDSGIRSSHFGEFTMGIELEMTSGDNDTHPAAESVRSRLGSSYCIIKSDGSLPHNGFEVVTMPHGLTKHIETFKAWDIDPAYRAWNTGKCGMHIHIDSRAFTQLTLGKFLMFINSNGNVDFIRKIAGRHPSVDDQARSYCAAEHQSILVNPKQAVKGKSGERYRMVNMMNLGGREALRLGLSMDNSYNGKYNTVELRIFRASLKKERLLAQIEFTHAAVMFCRVASWRDLNGASFIKWLRTVVGQYPALTKWYGVRAVHGATKQPSVPAEVTCDDVVPPAPSAVSSQTSLRHDHHYPFNIQYDSEGEHIRTWARRQDLFFQFALYSGSEYAVFPYGDMHTISSGDVIYERYQDAWVLMSEDYAGAMSQCSYVLTMDQPV